MGKLSWEARLGHVIGITCAFLEMKRTVSFFVVRRLWMEWNRMIPGHYCVDCVISVLLWQAC